MADAATSVARLEANRRAEQAWNAHVNAVVTSLPGAQAEAEVADKAARAGQWLGLLHGSTIAIKDNIETAGARTTMASLFFKDNVPNRDAPVVARLRKAGAVLTQKVTLHEFAFGVRSMSALIGQCKNPWDLSRIPGGSSGGSGVAVATGMADMALGTDTGGSVRIPAAINGITGLRPTSGRVPNSGCFPVSAAHDTIGPMARSALDCARLFAVIAGYDPDDPTSRRKPLENFLPTLGDSIAGVRIGVVESYYFGNVPPDRAAAIEAAIAELEKLGATIVRIGLPGAEAVQEACAVMVFCDACDVHRERMRQEALWAPQTIERLKLGLEWKGVDYAASVRAKAAWMRTLSKAFDEVDILLTPTVPIDPPPHAEDRSLWQATRAVAQNTYNGAFGHIPGIAVPCGFSRAGFPVSMQLEAAWWKEPLLLRVAHAYQQVTDWHLRRPPLPALPR